MSFDSDTEPYTRPTLSVVIIAQDEEKTIGAVLDAVREIADEIVLVDSGSTDRTVALALERKAKVTNQQWLGFAAQKNFALSLATSEWILSLDADEILTPELVAEIKQVMAGDLHRQFTGFKIARLMYVGDQPLRYGGFYPDAQLRLFKAGTGCFNDRLVHESVSVTGAVHQMRCHLHHRAYADVAGFRKAHEKYAKLAAEQAMRGNVTAWKRSAANLVLHPLWTFFYRYVCRAGFLDGILGLQMNLSYADYVRKKICYLRQKTR